MTLVGCARSGRVVKRVGLSVIDEGEQHEERQQIAEALGVANQKGGDQSDTMSHRPKAYTDQAAIAVKESGLYSAGLPQNVSLLALLWEQGRLLES